MQFLQNYRIPESACKSVDFGIGSTMQPVQQVMVGLGVDLKDGVCVFLYLLTRCPRGQQRFSHPLKTKPCPQPLWVILGHLTPPPHHPPNKGDIK